AAGTGNLRGLVSECRGLRAGRREFREAPARGCSEETRMAGSLPQCGDRPGLDHVRRQVVTEQPRGPSEIRRSSGSSLTTFENWLRKLRNFSAAQKTPGATGVPGLLQPAERRFEASSGRGTA